MKIWPEILIALAEIILLAIQLVSSFRDRLFLDKADALGTLLPLQIGVLVVYVGIRNLIERRDLNETAHAVRNSIAELSGRLSLFLNSLSIVRTLPQDDFYEEFSNAIRFARTSVAIAHLDTRPPSMVG